MCPEVFPIDPPTPQPASELKDTSVVCHWMQHALYINVYAFLLLIDLPYLDFSIIDQNG